MSLDPIEAVDEVIWRIDECVGKISGPCSNWIENASKKEIKNWLDTNIRARLENIKFAIREGESK